MPGVFGVIAIFGPDPMRSPDPSGRNVLKRLFRALESTMLASVGDSGENAWLMEHLERLVVDARGVLAACIREDTGEGPVVNALRSIILDAMRAYAFCVSCDVLRNPRCTNADATAAVLCSMADSGYGDLLAATVNSTHEPSREQDGDKWTLLRMTLSSDSAGEADRVARALLHKATEGKGELGGVVSVVSALCGVMRTRAGMMIFCHDPQQDGSFPLARLAGRVASELNGRNVVDGIMRSTTGTIDAVACASPKREDDICDMMDIFLASGKKESFCSSDDGEGYSIISAEEEYASDVLVARYCEAVRCVCTTWMGSEHLFSESTPELAVRAVRLVRAEEVWRSIRQFSNLQVAMHCEPMIKASHDIGIALEVLDRASGVPPLVHGCEHSFRVQFRANCERALTSAKSYSCFRGCCLLCALACVPESDGDAGVRIFARMLGKGGFVDVEDGSKTSRTRLWIATSECALDFERALQAWQLRAKPEEWLCLPSSAQREKCAHLLTLMAKGAPFDAPPLDATTERTLSLVKSAVNARMYRFFADSGKHHVRDAVSRSAAAAAAVGVLTASSVFAYNAPIHVRSRSVGARTSTFQMPLPFEKICNKLTETRV
jgi:hypothetical protein